MNYDIETMRALEWQYPVNYGNEIEREVDVLVIGGGLAGCHAAINAAKRGAKVAIFDKGPIVRSGSAGTGVDHWHNVCTGPAAKVKPEEMTEMMCSMPWFGGKFCIGMGKYITCKEAYETLMDLEKFGVPFRDMDDEFKGAPFRDDKTKIMYAYDYDAKSCVRLKGGALMKPLLAAEVERLGVEVFNYVMGTSLLTEDGKIGGRVIGATGVSIRTGEFYIVKAKAVVLASGTPYYLWTFNTELQGGAAKFYDPSYTGEGQWMAFKAGATFINCENNKRSFSGGFMRNPYGVGDGSNTWYGVPIVDSNGKRVPYIDRNGNEIEDDKLFHYCKGIGGMDGLLPRDIGERIKKGEFTPPFYADLPAMDPMERRVLWGVMVGNEGRTNLAVYKEYGKAGFDPDKDMLQVPFLPSEAYTGTPTWMAGKTVPVYWREMARPGCNTVVDWSLKTTLDGLYAAGYVIGSTDSSGASTTGRYAGRNAWKYAQTVEQLPYNREQIDKEKARLYAPVTRTDGIGWKEFKIGLCRVMQDYCGSEKNEEGLKLGLTWFDSIEEQELQQLYARNPHELGRAIECMSHIGVGRMVMHGSLARKASCKQFDFIRLDYPEMDPPEWDKYVTIKLNEAGETEYGDLPFKWYLKEPYAPTYEENYKKYCAK